MLQLLDCDFQQSLHQYVHSQDEFNFMHTRVPPLVIITVLTLKVLHS